MLEAVGTIDFTVVAKLGGKNVPVSFEISVQIESFDDNFERIIIPQIRVEIDVPGKDVGELQGQKQILAAPFQRRDQIALDRPPDTQDPLFIADGDLFGVVSQIRAADVEETVVVYSVDEGNDPLGIVEEDLVGTAGIERLQSVNFRRSLAHFVQLADIQAVFFKDLKERFALLDLAGDFAEYQAGNGGRDPDLGVQKVMTDGGKKSGNDENRQRDSFH